jgi:hypothetical protein
MRYRSSTAPSMARSLLYRTPMQASAKSTSIASGAGLNGSQTSGPYVLVNSDAGIIRTDKTGASRLVLSTTGSLKCVDANHAFFVDGDTFKSIPLAGGSATDLSIDGVSDCASDGSTVYYTYSGGLRRVAVGGGPVQDAYTGIGGIMRFAGAFYWLATSYGARGSCTQTALRRFSGDSNDLLMTYPNRCGDGLAISTSAAYFSISTPYELWSLPK